MPALSALDAHPLAGCAKIHNAAGGPPDLLVDERSAARLFPDGYEDLGVPVNLEDDLETDA